MAFEIITIDELIKRLERYNHSELHPHCTASPNIAEHWVKRPDGIFWQEAMRRVHMQSPRNWRDIAQHVTLLPNGLFVTGRDFGTTPASMTGFNGSAPNNIPFMVEMFGWFDRGKDVLQGQQKASILKLANWFIGRNKYIRFHSEHANKSCPGNAIIKSVFLEEAKNFGKTPTPTPVPKPQPINNPTSKPTLRQGDRGDFVKELQTKLNNCGFNVGRADGIFGAGTSMGVIEFQKVMGLSPDGIVGRNSWNALDAVRIGSTTATSLNVRSGASTSSTIVDRLPMGTQVPILKVGGVWFMIGVNKWIHQSYVALRHFI